MNDFNQWLELTLGIPEGTQTRVLESVLIVLMLWLTRRLVLRSVYRRNEDVTVQYRWRKASLYTAVTIGVAWVGGLWIAGLRNITTFFGLVSAGLAIALRDIIVNLAGWLFIVLRRPFSVGDRIQIGEHAGDVIDLRVFQFTILEIGNWVEAEQSTGRILHIPNGLVLTVPLANYNRGFRHIWHELPVVVTFESDWRKAKTILQEILTKHGETLGADVEKQIREAARRFMIFYANLKPIVYTSVVDHGVELTLRYLCDPKSRRGSAQAIWEDVLDAFAREDDIDFAYPTQRFYDNRGEGKPGAGGPPREP